jgi:hypothetical protein
MLTKIGHEICVAWSRSRVRTAIEVKMHSVDQVYEQPDRGQGQELKRQVVIEAWSRFYASLGQH